MKDFDEDTEDAKLLRKDLEELKRRFGGDGKKETLRILEFPIGEYEAQGFRDTLGSLLNDGAFEGTIPEGVWSCSRLRLLDLHATRLS